MHPWLQGWRRAAMPMAAASVPAIARHLFANPA